MNKILVMTTMLLMVVSLSAQANMERLSYQEMAEVTGQGYLLTVGGRSLSAPFAYDVMSSAAPTLATNGLAAAIGVLAPNYPAHVAGARTMAVGIANTTLGSVVGRLQMLPFIGGLVPSVSIAIH